MCISDYFNHILCTSAALNLLFTIYIINTTNISFKKQIKIIIKLQLIIFFQFLSIAHDAYFVLNKFINTKIGLFT